MTDNPKKETREYFHEISDLMEVISNAFNLSDSDTIKYVENHKIKIELDSDIDGSSFIIAGYGEKSIRFYSSNKTKTQ